MPFSPPVPVSMSGPGLIPALSGTASDVFKGSGVFGYPAISNSVVQGAGTNYSLTNSQATVTFGTTNPSLSLTAGTYLIMAVIGVTGANSVGTENNIQAQLYNSTDSATIGPLTPVDSGLSTSGTPSFQIILQEIVVLAGTKTITIQALNSTASAGSVVSTLTKLIAIRIG